MSDFSKAFGSLGSLMGSTAAGAIGNVASGVTNALFGGIQARRNWKYKQKEMALQQKYNLENMQKQFDYQQEAWDRENRYNDPRNASARWRLAGISPNAVFGNSPGGAGVAGSAGTPDVSNPSAGGNVDTSTYHPTLTPVEMMRVQNERKIADSQADLNNALADKARGDTKDPDITKRLQLLDLDRSELAKESERIQKDILDIEKDYKKYEKQADLSIKQQILFETMAKIDKLLADKEVSEETKKKLQADRDLIQEQINTEKAKQRNLDSNTKYNDAQTKTENELRRLRKSLTQAQVNEIDQKIRQSRVLTIEGIEKLYAWMRGERDADTLFGVIDKYITGAGKALLDERYNGEIRSYLYDIINGTSE